MYVLNFFFNSTVNTKWFFCVYFISSRLNKHFCLGIAFTMPLTLLVASYKVRSCLEYLCVPELVTFSIRRKSAGGVNFLFVTCHSLIFTFVTLSSFIFFIWENISNVKLTTVRWVNLWVSWKVNLGLLFSFVNFDAQPQLSFLKCAIFNYRQYINFQCLTLCPRTQFENKFPSLPSDITTVSPNSRELLNAA